MSKISNIEKIGFTLIMSIMVLGLAQGSISTLTWLLVFGILFQLFIFYYKRIILKENVSFARIWMPLIASIVLLAFVIIEKFL